MNRVSTIIGGMLFLSLMISCTIPEATGGNNSTNTGLSLITNYDGTEVIKAVYVEGDYLYAAAGYDGLIIFDVSNPTNIFKVTNGTWKTNHPVNDLVVKDVSGTKYAFLAMGNYNGTGGVVVVNVTDVTNILTTNENITLAGRSPNALAVSSDNATMYFADTYKTEGFSIYNNTIATPVVTVVAGSPTSLDGESAVDIVLDGTHAYLATGRGGVYILDISTPGAPVIAASLRFSISEANAIAISSSRMIVADKMGGIMIYDISTPAAPKLLSRYDTAGEAYDVYVNGTDVYVADGANGVLWLDITTPTAPTLKGQYSTSQENVYKIFYPGSGVFMYGACGPYGIKVFERTGS